MAIPTLNFNAATPDAPGLDLDKLIVSRMLIQANSGGGKSYALRALLEQTHGRAQQIVLDVEGEFGTLRERFDYVLAGVDGDVTVSVESARVLCRRLMELQASCIINLYDLSLPDRRRYVRLFLEELMSLPRALWRPLLVVIDECHVFVPERGSGEAESKDAVIALATQGRKRGYCLIAATQRLSKLHKDGAAELLNKLIGRTSLDVDVKRAADELGFNKAQFAQLKDLEPGSFYAYGPALSNVVTLTQIGTVQTSHPKAGVLGVGSAPPAPASMQSVLAELGDLPQAAQEEARTLEEYKQRLEAMQSILARSQASKGAPTVIEKIVEKVVEVPVLEPEQISRLVESAEAVKALVKDLGGVAATLGHEINDVLAALQQAQAPTAAPSPVKATAAPAPVAPVAPPRPAAARSASVKPQAVPDDLSKSHLRILNALAAFERLGLTTVARLNVAFFAGYTENGHFNNMVGTLRTGGYLDYPQGGMLALTDAGRAVAAPDQHPINSLDDLHEVWLEKITASEAKLLKVLIRQYPEAVTRARLAQWTGYTENGHFNNMVGHLRTLGVVDYPRPGHIVATSVLFPLGLK